MMTDDAARKLTNEDLYAIAVRLIALTSRFKFRPDGYVEVDQIARNERDLLGPALNALADDLNFAAARIRPVVQYITDGEHRGRVPRYIPPPRPQKR
jgi:hypothetical protein